ncbi:MAG: adenylosuccinate synthetase, partial [Calditrichaeota bacterium]|nr:adenylosuccinate synthetase [Calditrichota bacterium]
TGRPRRCGWFDAVIARYAVRINGIDGLAMTKLDVLDRFESIKVCTGYELDGKVVKDLPTDLQTLSRCRPVYEALPGWQSSTANARSWEELPPAARDYLAFLEEQVGAPAKIISVGSKRSQTIIRG